MINLTGEQITASITAIAIAIAQGKPPRDVTLLGDIFSQLGSALTVIGDRNGQNEP